MTSNYIQPPANTGTGLKIDTSELTVGVNVVERQNVCIADPTTDVAIGKVTRFNPTAAYAPIVYNSPVYGATATYMSAGGPFSMGTAATSDIVSIYGSASTLVRVVQVGISWTTATTAAYYDVILLKKSTVSSGGVPSTGTNVALDSAQAAATATVKIFSAAPTSGVTVGAIGSQRYFSPVTGTPAPVTPVVFDFSTGPCQGPTLRGVAEGLVINIGGVAPANVTSIDFWIKWTEE